MDCRLQTRLTPRLAAWIAADVCRSHFAGADPLPMHADAPIVACDHGSTPFRVRYARGAASSSYRAVMNGRLGPAVRRRHSVSADLPEPKFRPSGRATGLRGSASDSADLWIETAPTGAIVSIELVGEVADSDLVEHLQHALLLAETGTGLASLPSDHASQPHQMRSCCSRHGPLLARVLFRMATQTERSGALAKARILMQRALDNDDQLLAARLWLRRLDNRMARQRDEAASLEVLAARTDNAELAKLAAAQLEVNRSRRSDDDESKAASKASELLATGDGLSAQFWAQRAREGTEATSSLLRLEAALHRQRGDHRRAFESGLAELERNGYAPDVVLALHDDSVAMGDAKLALRLLAHNWDRLWSTHSDDALDRLRRTALMTGPGPAARIFLAEGAEHRAQRLLSRWATSGEAGEAAIAVLARVQGLRASSALATPSVWSDNVLTGYEFAPGVSPPR